MAMIGMKISFTQRIETGTDDFNNPTYTEETFEIDDCLVAPPTEPIDRVESAALDRNSTVVRVHLPKANERDISNSEFTYEGEKFRVIGRPVKFMNANTPTRWNRYLRAESVSG